VGVTLALIYPATTIAFSASLTVLIPNDDLPTRPQRSWYCRGQEHAIGVPGFNVAAVGGFPRRQLSGRIDPDLTEREAVERAPEGVSPLSLFADVIRLPF
jgi:hypothetical protein